MDQAKVAKISLVAGLDLWHIGIYISWYIYIEVYTVTKKRLVKTAPGFEREILRSIQPLSLNAKQNACVAYDTLWLTDPPIKCRCGLLDSRYEVFALDVEGSPNIRFVISIDRSDVEITTVLLHGILSASNIIGASGQLVARHLSSTHRPWET